MDYRGFTRDVGSSDRAAARVPTDSGHASPRGDRDRRPAVGRRDARGPKVRAMEIIEELEPTRRGIYAGSVMYLDYSGNLDSCIAIRTILVKDGRAYIQAGAGIVADSVPETEYVETVNK